MKDRSLMPRLDQASGALLLCALSFGCSDPPAKPAAVTAPDKAVEADKLVEQEVSPLPAPARALPLSDDRKIYPRLVGEAVDTAIYMGAYKAMEELSRKLDPSSATHMGAPAGPTPGAEQPKGKLLTIWHTGNVRGEREDCGCKKHPMGGLTRKATLIQNASKGGRDLDKPDGSLIVDAGDLFFAGTHVGRLTEKDQALARIRAEAIVASFNEIGCAAFLPGEYDLALGLKVLTELKSAAKFPFVSANLSEAGSNTLLFEPFVVTESAGFKVLIVGLTNPTSAQGDYYTRAGVEVSEPVAALRAQAAAIKASGAQVVVLLSNLGVDGTTKVLRDIGGEVEVTAALVSNSATSTHAPIWSGATPVLESGNRGKFLGRADLHIVEGKAVFKPGESNEVSQVRAYMNAYRSLHHARRAVGNIPVESKDAARRQRIERNLDLAVQRLARTEELLPEKLEGPADAVETKSWLHSQVVPVELSIVQDQKIRRLLDGYEKKASAFLPKPPQRK